jgi:pyruvate-formate lyase-activating enzyme
MFTTSRTSLDLLQIQSHRNAPPNSQGFRVLLLQLARNNPYSDVEQDVYAPIGIAYVASALEQCGYQVEIGIHPPASRNPGEGLPLPSQFLNSTDLPDLFGISATGNEISDLLHLAKMVKAVAPSIPIIAGGYCSMKPDLVLSTGAVDVVVIGEGERTIAELAPALLAGEDLSKISGIAYRHGKDICLTPTRQAVDRLDDLPLPRYRHYPSSTRKVRVYASRGCPYKCTYCSIKDFFATSKIRYHSLDYMRRVIRYLQDRSELPIELVFFNDDEFLLNPGHLVGMATLARELNFRICFQTRTQDVVRFARELERHADAIYQVHMGVEAFSQTQLDRWQKSTTIGVNREALQILSKIGCSYYPYLILSDHKTTPAELVENCNGILDLPASKYELDHQGRRVDASLSPLHWGLHLNRYKTFLGDVERSPETEYLEGVWEFIWATQSEADRLCGLYRHSLAAAGGAPTLTTAEVGILGLLNHRIRKVAELAIEVCTLKLADGIARSREQASIFNQSAGQASVEYMCCSLAGVAGLRGEHAHAVV